MNQGYINPDDDLDEKIEDPSAIAEMGDTFAEHPANQHTTSTLTTLLTP